MRLRFDKDSLALKSLQDGVVDFSHKDLKIKAASLDQSLPTDPNHPLMEVDLGELRSLGENQLHIDEVNENTQLIKGQTIVDD